MHRFLTSSLLVFFVFFAASACGGSGCSPASPSAHEPPTVATAPATNLTIAGPNELMVGRTATYDATATLSTGATIYHVSDIWTTDNAAVATISSKGVLMGQGPGIATITATYRGAGATAAVRVLPKPASRPFPARANLVVFYSPDPVPAASTPCDRYMPTWSYSLTITETQGVGFTLEVGTWNLYDENGGQLYGGGVPEDDYFAPNSVFAEDICTSLAGRPSGSAEDILEGVDDNGNRLTFSSRLRFLPAAGVSSILNRLSPHLMAPASRVRRRHRVRRRVGRTTAIAG